MEAAGAGVLEAAGAGVLVDVDAGRRDGGGDGRAAGRRGAGDLRPLCENIRLYEYRIGKRNELVSITIL